MIFSKLNQLLRKIGVNRFVKIQKVNHRCDYKLRSNTSLLKSLHRVRLEWLDAKRDYEDNPRSDDNAINGVTLARRKYLFLYHIARNRQIQGHLTIPMFKG